MRRYHPALVVLHWLLAVMIIVALIMGGNVLAALPNDDPEKLVSLQMHMGAGIVILGLMVIRIILRLTTQKPPKADIGNGALNTVGGLMHWVLYAVVIAMCVSGLALANMAGLPEIVFGGSGDPLPADFSEFAPRMAHGALAMVLKLLILGHIAAALYHQFVRKDGLLSRMWFGNRRA